MGPITAFTSMLGALVQGPQLQTAMPAQADAIDQQTEDSFLDLLEDLTDLVSNLLPGIDLGALGPFDGALTNIIVLIATVLVAIAAIRAFIGVGKATVLSGGDKGKIREGWAQFNSSMIFIVVVIGLPFFISLVLGVFRWVFSS